MLSDPYLTATESKAALRKLKKEDVLGFECKHAYYTESNKLNSTEDALVVKEIIHLKDGRKIPNVRIIENYKRPFAITLPKYRTHKDRKESELLSKLKVYKSTQRNLTRSIVKAIGFGNPNSSVRHIATGFPYLYGVDIGTPALIKHMYKTKWPDLASDNHVAVFDSETDMRTGETRDPLVFSVTYRGRIYSAYLKEWVSRFPTYEQDVRKMLDEHIKEEYGDWQYEYVMEGFDTFGQVAAALVAKVHEWQPDILVAHNVKFDIQVLLNALQKENYDLSHVFSDPRVPAQYHNFEFTEDRANRTKADGTTLNFDWYDLWHKLDAPCSFYTLCSAATYRLLRLAGGKETSYSLNYILKKVLGVEKKYVRHPDVKAREDGVDWHREMQLYDPVGYTVYNVFDNLRIEQLDEKTQDLSLQLSMMSDNSHYFDFKSNPKRTADKLHFFYLKEEQSMVGTTSGNMDMEFDEHVVGRDGWIRILPSHLVGRSGIKMIKEMPDVCSMMYRNVSDADITSTYPYAQISMNISKATLVYEFCKVKGMPYEDRQLIGYNLTGGISNSIPILERVTNAPSTIELLEAFERKEA